MFWGCVALDEARLESKGNFKEVRFLVDNNNLFPPRGKGLHFGFIRTLVAIGRKEYFYV